MNTSFQPVSSRNLGLVGVALLVGACGSDSHAQPESPFLPDGAIASGGSVGSGGASNPGSGGASNDAGAAKVATNTIGPAGGAVAATSSKFIVSIPAGALTSPVAVTVAPAAHAPSGYVGTAYELGPTGTQFSKPVTLAFQYEVPFGDPSTLKIGTVNASGAWEAIPSSADTTRVLGTTTHFSIYAVISVEGPDGGGGAGDAGTAGTGGTTGTGGATSTGSPCSSNADCTQGNSCVNGRCQA